ncbi:IclR family transcriptional regulator domain-containing protein [Phyllobacterium chamaecytisi]|uniref:IclR family transcriptional regulator domain-containing protein n=1 Tax=Phyllobacterium chamaecytisi TaxID=2876082 RepID=UPI001CCE0E9E|nr:IclR family transcriptional regulator C-terminal domain-containing protein [Phyllobacterium sp. KW56]MBZ9603032.1 helix-turn-helix domain-containing protein [Phyllobacterium sp. KW56]
MVTKTDFIASLAKGLKVIEAFRDEFPQLTISDAAEKTGLDRATTRRCLLTIHQLGYADFDGKFFTLTPRILRLGTGALAAMPFVRLMQPWLDQLSLQIDQPVSVCVLDETEIVYVAHTAPRRVMSVGMMPGSRLPAHCTAMGRVLLSALPDAEARAKLDASDLSPRTQQSLTDAGQIMDCIAKIRIDGYSYVDQELEIGLRAIAVPVYNARGRIVAALSTGVAAFLATPEELVTRYLPALLKTQEGVRRILR